MEILWTGPISGKYGTAGAIKNPWLFIDEVLEACISILFHQSFQQSLLK